MKLKRCLVLFLVGICSFAVVAASGNNELGYIQVGSQSEDPFVSMKTLTSIERYAEDMYDRVQLQFEEAIDNMYLQFSDEIDLFYAMEPEIWETDEMFEERYDQEEERLVEAMYSEGDKIRTSLIASLEQQTEVLDGYAAKARANLLRSRTLASSPLRVQNTSYDRNARLWSLSLSSSDKELPFTNIPLALDFTTIGDEATIRREIITFDEAVKSKSLTATVDWHYMQDSSNGRFLLVIDFLTITNPLTGNSYAVNLAKPILLKTYKVTGETVPTLAVLETTKDSILGVADLVYSDDTGNRYTLSSANDTHFLAWNVSKQGQRPILAPYPSPVPAAPVAKDEVVFRIANGAEPESLDPALIQGVPEHRLYLTLFEGLVAIDPETALAVPGVAESLEISEDLTQYTFKLRKDALWSDGKPITAHDVVYSWLRILDPATAGPYAWFPCMFLAGAEAFNYGIAGPEAVGIRALDDHTFQMDLLGPLPYALDALTHYSFAIVPKHAIEKYGSAWTDPANFVGNGPFTLSERVAWTSIIATKSDTYWDKENVHLDKVIFYSSDSDITNYNMFLNGEIDWATDVPPDQLARAETRSDFQKSPQLATYYYVFQNEKAPLNNPLVRQALSLAIDRQALVEGVTKAGQIPAWGVVPPMAGYEALEFPFDDQDEAIELAQKYLSDAGYPNGAGFPTLSILYNTNEGHKQIAQFIQQEWRDNLGICVRLENQEWQAYLSNRNQGNFLVARAGWVGDYADPNAFLDMFITGAGMNGGRYNNEIYDLLINEAARMEAGPDRMGVLRVAEDIMINQDQGMIPLYYYVAMHMVNTEKWGGWHTNVMDYHPLKNIYLK